jgi:hypothetical protein
MLPHMVAKSPPYPRPLCYIIQTKFLVGPTININSEFTLESDMQKLARHDVKPIGRISCSGRSHELSDMDNLVYWTD